MNKHLEPQLVIQPPWGHWHELYTVPFDVLSPADLMWLELSRAHIERNSIHTRLTWSMPESMCVVYGPWAPTLHAAIVAAKPIYETKVLPYGTPEEV